MFEDKTDEDFGVLEKGDFKIRKLVRDMLSAFACVRLFKTSSVPKVESSKLPTNKGTLDDAIAGEQNNLIRVCYESKDSPIIMPRPEVNEDVNILIDKEDDSNGEAIGEIEDVVLDNTPVVIPPQSLLTKNKPRDFLSNN